MNDWYCDPIILDMVPLTEAVESGYLHAYDSDLSMRCALVHSRVSAEGLPRRKIFVNPELSGPIFRKLFIALNTDCESETLVPLFLYESATGGAAEHGRERQLLSMRLDKRFPVEGISAVTIRYCSI